VAQMTTEEDGNSLDGVAPETFVPDLEARGADVVGLNCSVGPAAMLEALERMARVAHVKLAAQPNAGKPREIEGRNLYLSSPDYMASYARRFINAGVRLVGGCCGTTPEHIRAIKVAVRSLAPGVAKKDAKATAPAAPVAAAPPVPREQKSRMANTLARGGFVVTVELTPPRGYHAEALVDQARALKIHGVDLVNIPDNPRASAHMSALAAAFLIQQHSGVETILHYACRDRHLLSMQSDLLGAHAMGVRNVLLVTGDPPKVGDYADATSVLEVDSIGLTNAVSQLNGGLDIGGQALGQPTAFHIGVAVNPCAPNCDEEVRRFAYKVEAGAEFAITQPVFDADEFRSFVSRITEHRVPLLAGIMPLESVRHAEFMANEVPGVRVPERILERMRKAEGDGRAADEGLAIAREIASEIRPLVQGIQISTAPRAVKMALAVIDAVGA
jgi:5,10-methylenetetrahydrofolate reductase